MELNSNIGEFTPINDLNHLALTIQDKTGQRLFRYIPRANDATLKPKLWKSGKKLSSRLFEEGVFALPIVYPMVATDKARIRTIMNAALTREYMDYAVNAFEKIGKELEII